MEIIYQRDCVPTIIFFFSLCIFSLGTTAQTQLYLTHFFTTTAATGLISRCGRRCLEAGTGAWNPSPSNETEHGRTGAITPPAARLSTITHRRPVRAAPKPLGSARRPDSSGPASPAPASSDQRVPDCSDVHGTKEALPTTTARTHAATNEPTTVITGGGGTESPSTVSVDPPSLTQIKINKKRQPLANESDDPAEIRYSNPKKTRGKINALPSQRRGALQRDCNAACSKQAPAAELHKTQQPRQKADGPSNQPPTRAPPSLNLLSGRGQERNEMHAPHWRVPGGQSGARLRTSIQSRKNGQNARETQDKIRARVGSAVLLLGPRTVHSRVQPSTTSAGMAAAAGRGREGGGPPFPFSRFAAVPLRFRYFSAMLLSFFFLLFAGSAKCR